MIYYFFILGKTLALLFPRRVCYFVAKVMASAYFHFSQRDRVAIAYNMIPIINDKQKINGVVKNIFINFAYYLVDFFRYEKLDKKFIEKYVKVVGAVNLDKVLSEKKGIIALTAHLGNYELGGAVTSLLGYPLHAVALPHKDKRLNFFFDKQRQRVGIHVIPTGVAVKKCYSVLKQGGIVAFLGDKNFTGGGIKTDMFSRKIILPQGAAFFSIKTEACIIPCFFLRENKYFYNLIFDEPISYDKKDPNCLELVIKKYVSVLEKYIRQYPDQWYMFQKCWIE